MKLRRRVAAIVLIGTMVVCGETRRASAQNATHDAPPDLRMLMNLDLFEPRHNNAQAAPAPAASPGDDSMLDQIRTLDAMGYLGSHDDADAGDLPAPASRGERGAGCRRRRAFQGASADTVEPAELRRRGAAAMTRRRHIASAFIVAALILCGFAPATPAHAQSSPPPGASMPSSDAERALAAQHPREWANLTPDQRERVLENYRRWQSMRPEERQKVQQNFQTFRNLPPEERKRVLEGLRRWRQLPEARRDELQHDYARYRGLPPDQRDKMMKRYQQFEQLPPAQRERMMANWHRWQQMTPEQRREARRRLGLWRQHPHQP